MSNAELRAKLAALSFREKIKILERLRDRGPANAKAGLRKGGANAAQSEVAEKDATN